ncbi:MAG: adenosylcobalamin-dependent ribonucleoside-diphosphate reductase [Desulfobulbaceae bacterium]|nr:adenosylcobalamin-dependent ribonucleoside-diphosphate reductase [Desulfobulbaceae bacterium]
MKKIILSELAQAVLEKRYFGRNYRGEILENSQQLIERVSRAVAEADRLFEAGAQVKRTARIFEEAISTFSFLPNSPCLMNAGRPLGQLAACFVLPIEDSLESIFQTLKDTALIHETGGGTGFSFSRLRPKGDTILPAIGVAGGPLSFINLFDTATYLIDRNRVRPGANMGILHISHPDIEEFIASKQTPGNLCNFNLSVAVDDLFIQCLERGEEYPLVHPRTGVAVRKVAARQLMDLIAESAWKTGDPGIIFIDRINRANPVPGMGRLEATNPCGEQPLLPYESCTLGSINLTKILENGAISYDKLDELVSLAIHFLDNVIEINRYPFRRIEELSKSNRKVGLGLMGFADMLLMMKIPYQSKKTIELANTIMARIKKVSEEKSAELAEKRGNFPSFDHSIFPAKGIKKRRNATLTTIAPTGTISLIAGVSSGIEPVFAYELERRVVDKVWVDKHALYAKLKQKGEKIPEEIFQTAWDVAPEWHLKVQSAFQKYTDNAVSKTINMPNSATVEDVKKLFLLALKEDVKGFTVYRDQSLANQILGACSLKRDECS